MTFRSPAPSTAATATASSRNGKLSWTFVTQPMMLENLPPGWSRDFDAWAAEALGRGDVEELCRYTASAPGMPYAHPTVDHFISLFLTIGAATDPAQPAVTVIDGYMMGLSKRSFQVV